MASKKTTARKKAAPKKSSVKKRAFAGMAPVVDPAPDTAPQGSFTQPVPAASYQPAPPAQGFPVPGTAPAPAPTYAPPQYVPGAPQVAVPAPPAYSGQRQYRGRGGYQNRQDGQQGDAQFDYVGTLFPAKGGKSFNAFIKPAALQILLSAREGDVIGVSSAKNGRGMNLWIRRMS